MTYHEITDLALELGESWINGNRNTVAEELASLPPLTAAAIAAHICEYLSTSQHHYTASADFAVALHNHAVGD